MSFLEPFERETNALFTDIFFFNTDTVLVPVVRISRLHHYRASELEDPIILLRILQQTVLKLVHIS